MKNFALIIFALCTLSWTGCDTLTAIQKTMEESSGGLSTSEIVGGLKQALEIGTSNASKGLNKTDGYFKDPLVKIPFPSEAQRAADKLRQIGLGSTVDNFVERLNRGAESAAVEAAPIFVNAIKQMTFADARQILAGPDNAATEYFKGKTSASLFDRFSPIIRNTLEKVNAASLWNTITTTYNKIPLVNKVETDIVKYGTNKALDGLFMKLAGEEKKIRDNPAARVTDLLQKVFGSVQK